MRITLIVATPIEIQPILNKYSATKHAFKGLYVINDHFHILITGMGMLQTAAHLMWYVHQFERDFYINIGLAGAFNRNLELGEIVQVSSESYGDFGVELDENFEELTTMGFVENTYDYNSIQPILAEPHQHIQLKKVTSITVNKVNSNEQTIQSLIEKYNADIENMEGMAFYYVMTLMEKPSIEIRAISNYVEKRTKENWKMDLAIKNLNNYIANLLEKIT